MSLVITGQTYSLGNMYHVLVTILAVAYPHAHHGAEASHPRHHTMLTEDEPSLQNSTDRNQAKAYRLPNYIGGKYCSKVKKMSGMAYHQIEGEKEPNLSLLKLDFQSEKESQTFDLGELATALPNMRGLNGSTLIICIHGFTDEPSRTNIDMIKALHSIEHCSILVLDAGPLLSWLYLRATTYVRFIGERLGETLVTMTRRGLDRKRIHLIGHSLGAHIAGFAGAQFKKLTGKKVGRVTGLDPAGQCFADVNETLRLSHRQAEFVDVIHTNSGGYGFSGVGLLGHVDFFPNGGAKQPDCFVSTCSHTRALEIYAESIINHTAFYGVKCSNVDNWYSKTCSDKFRIMGHGASTDTRGQFYLRTLGKSPFGLGVDGMFYKKKGWWFWSGRRKMYQIL